MKKSRARIRSARAVALALSAVLLAGGAGGVTLSGKFLSPNETDKGGAALRSDTDIVRADIDEVSHNQVYTSKAPYTAMGGGIYSDASVTLTRSGKELTLSYNSAEGDGSWRDARGGAVYAGGDITLSAATVTLAGNEAETNSDYLVEAFGGALYSRGGVTITADNGLNVRGNSADGKETGGGAVYAGGNIVLTGGVITVRDNSTDGENNTNGASSYGGALNSGSGTVKLKAADEVLVSVNAVKRMTSWASGGAISAYKGITIEGGSVTVRDNTVATASSGEHKENNLAHGGALNSSAGDVTIAADGAVALSNNALTDIGGSAAGGAVHTEKTFSLSGGSVKVSNNKADASLGTWSHGGAVYAGGVKISSTGAVEVSDNSVYSGSKTAYGGAVYTKKNFDLIGGGATISGNKADAGKGTQANGGAIYAASSASLAVDYELTLEDNHAAATGSVRGGALYAEGDLSLSAGYVTLQNNSAAEAKAANAAGGALYSYGSATISADSFVTILNNSVAGKYTYGGAVFAKNGLDVSGCGITVRGNTADGPNSEPFGSTGGAIDVSDGAAKLNVTGSVAVLEWVDGVLTLKLVSGDVEVEKNAVKNASSWAYGGAIAATGGIELSGGDVAVRENSVTAKKGSGSAHSFAHGGGLFSSGGDVTLTANRALTLANNSVTHGGENTYAAGGAVYTDKNATLTGASIAISGNTAGGDSCTTAYGGAVHARTVSLTASGALDVTGNSVAGVQNAYGGAVYANNTLKLSGASVSVTGNSVKATGDGGEAHGGALGSINVAVSATGASVKLSSNTAESSKTSASGGAVWARQQISVTGGAIEAVGNAAKSAGAGASGGALYAEGSDVTLKAGSGAIVLADNTASGKEASRGGAVAARGVSVSGGTIDVSGNEASGADDQAQGGAVYAAENAAELIGAAGVTLAKNKAEVSAGTKNVTAYGGAVYAAKGAKVQAAHGAAVLSGNEANAASSKGQIMARGAAVYAGEGDVTIAGTQIEAKGNAASAVGSANSSAVRGGTLGAQKGAVTLTATAGPAVFANNTAAADGGTSNAAVYGGAVHSGSGVTVEAAGDVRFEKNTASAKASGSASSWGRSYGGAIYDQSENAEVVLKALDRLVLVGNEAAATGDQNATASGGAVYAKKGAVTLSAEKGITVQSNKAGAGGSQTAAEASGGVVRTEGQIELLTAGSMTIDGNEATAGDGALSAFAYGGAFYARGGVTLSSGGALTVANNKAAAAAVPSPTGGLDSQAFGGAVYSLSETELTAGGTLALTANGAKADRTAQGGAVYAAGGLTLTSAGLNAQGSSVTAAAGEAAGGALYASGAAKLNFGGGAAALTNNTASGSSNVFGGAVYAGGDLSLSGGKVSLTGNTASAADVYARGGALYAGGAATITAAEATFKNNSVNATKAADGGAIWAGTGATITTDRVRFLSAGDSVYVENGAITVNGSLEMANTSLMAQTGGITVGVGTFKPHDVAHSDSVTADQLPQFYATSGKVDLGGSKLALYNAFAEDTDHFERDFAFIQANEYDISGLKTSAESDYRHGVLHEEALAGGTKLWLEFGIASLTWKNGDGPWGVNDGKKLWTRDSDSKPDDFYQSDHVTFAPTTGDNAVKITLQQDIVASSTTVKGSYAFSEHELRTGALTLTAGDSSFAMPVTADDAALSGGSLKLDETLTVKNSFTQGAGTKLTIAADETLAILNGDGTAALDASAGALHIAGIGAMNGGETKTYKVAADFASLKPWDKNAVTTDAAGLRVEQTPDTDSATYYNLTVSCLGNIPLIWNGGTNVWKTGDTSKLWLRESDGTTPDDFYDGDSAAFTGTKSGTVTVNGTVKPEKMSVTGGTYTFAGGSIDANEVNFAGGESTVESTLIAQTAALSGGKLKLSTPLKVTGSFTQNAGTTLTVPASETAAILNGSGTAALNAGGALFIEGIGALSGGTTKTYKIAENFASLVPWADADLGGDATGLRLSYAGVKGAHTYDVNVTALGNISLLWNGGSNTWAENDGNLLWLRESDVTTKDDFYGGDSVVFEANTEKQTVTLSSGLEADGMAVNGDYLFKGSDLKVRSLHVVGGESELAAAVTADTAEQSGGSLKLSAPLTLKTAFTQSEGATLIVPASETAALLNGSGTAALNASGLLTIEGIGALANGETKTFRIAEKFASLTPWADDAVTTDAAGFRLVCKPQTDGKTYYSYVVSSLGFIPLIWNGGTNVWKTGDTTKLWLRENDGTTKDDFYNGDSAIFPENSAAQTVTLTGALEAAAMTVNGSYVFAGGGTLNVGALTVNGGQSEFAREFTAKSGLLTGGSLTLSKPLTVSEGFTQKSGSTLIVDVDSTETVLIGQSGAKLTVESGAKLYLANAQSSLDGVKYTVATGFDVASAWQDADVDGSAGGFGVKYAVSEESGSVIVTVTGEPYDGFPFILTAGQSLRGAASVGTALQNRGAGLLSAPAGPMTFARGFMPMEKGKAGGTWASAWYTHARVDNDTADMKFKNYGVTLGADKLLRCGASVGVAVNLGKTEGRGRGAFDGSDSDGKHIGISLYGAKNIARGNVTLTGDVGFSWHRDDYDSTMYGSYYRARKAKSRVFTAGATAWWNLPVRGKVGVKPFLGLRYSRFSMDDFTAEKNGTSWANIGGESVSQWTVPLGVKFDWTPVTTKKGWRIKPSVELAYVFAGGDRDMNVRVASVRGGTPVHETQMLSDKHNFRASLGLDAKRKNMTLGLGVNALLSSGQKDVAVNATVRWDL